MTTDSSANLIERLTKLEIEIALLWEQISKLKKAGIDFLSRLLDDEYHVIIQVDQMSKYGFIYDIGLRKGTKKKAKKKLKEHKIEILDETGNMLRVRIPCEVIDLITILE
ncbi:hypothetical protein DRN75_02270 [Nanoarchaeota archaeon]|nr:MAG: hypothetical protein DRN75_02270 [Nanoarchaeota archaeon]